MDKIDRNNVLRYAFGANAGYRCKMCERSTTLDDSVSCRGFNLICNTCMYKLAQLLDVTNGRLLEIIQDVGERRERDNIERHKDRKEQRKC